MMSTLVAFLSRPTTPANPPNFTNNVTKLPVVLPNDVWECVLDYVRGYL